MSKADPFEDPKLLIKDARKHVKDLNTRFRSWVGKRRPVTVVKYDPQTGERVAKMRFAHKMPGDFRVLASNALNNLRHSLDQAVNCASLQLSGSDRNYFPFAEVATDMDRALRDRCKGVPSKLHPLLRGFQPYPGGDDFLVVLQIAGVNKHRRILELDADIAGATIDFYKGVRVTPPVRIGFRWDSNKQELEFARIGKGGKIDGQLKRKLSIRMLLSDAPTPNNEPAAAVLYALADKVESILLAIEAETARLLRGP